MIVAGIDPGQKDTGVIIRDGDTLLAYRVVSHQGWDTRAVIDEIRELMIGPWEELTIGVEGVTQPGGFRDGKKSIISWTPLLCTAGVLGAVLATWPMAVIVPPGGNGSAPLFAYPKQLVGARETTGTAGRFRHLRSAWDVAGAVPRLLVMGHLPGGRAA